MSRSSGVLLAVSSLPGAYGIGGFSLAAAAFAEKIAGMGFSWWQILPLTLCGEGDSPYAGESAFAGNVPYVDPDGFREGALTGADKAAARYPGQPYLTDYAHAGVAKRRLLESAYAGITADEREK
ncbi:MAG: 4-alpha-glucanotransferase, partial [Clostridiales bacterium]|nr:4-alpha-glucanotransferase [Clostridiales bacterium]